VVPASWRDATDLAGSRVRPLCVLCRAGGDRDPARSAWWVRAIARTLGRAPSTISRELRRNGSTRTYRLEYRASTAQWHPERRVRRPKVAKLALNDQLREYVQDRLAGAITRPDGELVAGPEVGWIGRRHGRRQDRRWPGRGAQSRSRTASRSISRMMSPCGSRTRRSIRRSMCKAGVRWAASWSRACGPGEHGECHELEPGSG